MPTLQERAIRGARLVAAIGVAWGLAGCGSPVETANGAPGLAAPAPRPSEAKPVLKGALRQWPEASSYLRVDLDSRPATVELGPQRQAGLDAFWSIASTASGGTAFFYSDLVRDSDETRVAVAANVARVQDIRDASIFDYSAASVGPVAAGAIVVLHHLPSDRYLALVLDAIAPTGVKQAGSGPYAYADVTWYLTAEGGGGNFSAAF